ncbi:MAG: hypothetical protein Q7R96_03385 [Nanoarchaeota archaeon]|nr:hypothetical protein [Nanoarchaeota archaeon]
MKKGTAMINWMIYIIIGIALLIFLYYGVIKPILTTGTAIAGELG